MRYIDQFLLWALNKRSKQFSRFCVERAPERTMALAMSMVEAVMNHNPEAAMTAIRKGGENWGVMDTSAHVHTAECTGEQVH